MKGLVRVVQYGVGAMGSNMVRLVLNKSHAKIVGAIDRDPTKIGRDLGEVVGLKERLGIKIDFPPEKVLNRVKADVVLHATTAFMNEAYLQIMKALERKINVVTIAQELFFPLGKNIKKAEEINEKARKMGVSITATGINPGFIMDIIPIVCSLPCWEIKRVTVRRVVDFSPYGPDEMQHIGAGLTPEEFTAGVKKGRIGHVGLLETSAMVAHCLGLHIDELRQKKEPLVSLKARKSAFISISPGRVCGFRQQVVGLHKSKEVLTFKMVGIVSPDTEEDGVELGDYTRIEGTPSVDVTIKEEISQKGGLGTAAVAVNMIPKVLESPPGFHTVDTLTLPHIWAGARGLRPLRKIKIYP